MFKKITIITLLTITTTTNYSILGVGEEATNFELGKIAPDQKSLVLYPGGNLYKFSSPKKIIVRRTEGTLKYGIALHFWKPTCDTHTLLSLVDFDKNSHKMLYKPTRYEDIYLLSAWLIKKDSPDHANDTCEWSSDAEAGDLVNEIKEQQPTCN